jgi:cyanophycinase
MAVRNAQRWFAGIGLRVSELPAIRRSDTRSPEWVAAARRGRFFYLVGGDPGIVPRTLAGTPLWETVTEAWRGGAALSGSSAGAMALCEWTLVRERVPGDARRRYKSALGIVPRVAVIPHFDSFGHRWVRSAISGLPQDDAVLLGIDERTAVVWTGGAWSRLGEGSVTVLRGGGGERFEDDTPIDGLPAPLFR